MDRELISKKELLQRCGISYGALYRWKRMGLIPEDWFIKRSTPTGQETFFPRDLILERMEAIRSQKDDASLEELSSRFNKKAKQEAMLVIDTVYGKKTFQLSEIRSVFVECEGESRSLTKAVLGKEANQDQERT